MLRKTLQRICFAVGGWVIISLPLHAEESPLVFAAASLGPVLSKIQENYEGKSPTFSFASSGALAKQIAAGAPADLFLSANGRWADWLLQQNTVELGRPQPFISNQLVLAQNINSNMTTSIKDLIHAKDRIALGDPNHVPAGIYAKQALQHFGLWEALHLKLAPTQNVRAAVYLLQTGAVPLALLYKSDLTHNPQIKLVETFPASSHDPILYQALQVNSTTTADTFFQFLLSEKSMVIFEKYGFTPVP